MANKCPNKSHPDWKALVAKHGIDGANLKYVQNGYEIPSQDGKSNTSKVNVKQRTGIFGNFFKSKDTLASMEKNPELAAEIIDELNQYHPDVKVYKDRIIDENGNYLEIPSDKQGRHYRNAFMSAVAWSNDSALETPPHEYAHEYIDMFRETEVVKKAISKYGEERLVELIARKYTGQKMSSSFENTLRDFWNAIRRVFGSPSVIDSLTKSFATNEAIGDKFTRGSEAVHNFQEASQPKVGKETPFNYDEDTEIASEKAKILTKEEVEGKVFDELNKKYDFFNKTEQESVDEFEKFWRDLVGKVSAVTRMDAGQGDVANYSAMDKGFIDYVNDVFTGNSTSKKNVIQKIRGEEVKLSYHEQQALDNIYKLYQGVEYRSKVSNVSYIDPNVNAEKQIINEGIVDKKAIKEVTTQLAHKAGRLASKNPVFQWIDKNITKQLKWVTNSRLWAKYLSGSENSMVSRVLYKGLNNGREGFSQFTHDFLDIFKSRPTSLEAGSTYHNKKAHIDKLETQTFKLDSKLNPTIENEILRLTKAEMLMVYLMNRQKGGKANLDDGIFLNYIEGRHLAREDKYKLTDEQIYGIVDEINKDLEAQEFIREIDAAMEYQHKELNSVYRLLEGFDLEKVENYFPMFHGAEKDNIQKSKNVIENMRNLRLRSSSGMAVRLEDPFKALSNMRMSNASYVGYAIPIHNAQKMIQKFKSRSLDKADAADYIGFLEGNINQIQDNALLYSTQGDKKAGQLINKLQGNFAVALLAYNPGVIMKQQVSLETAATVINRMYIRRSGASLGGLNFIDPIKLLKQLTFKGDATMLPIEWKKITNNASYQELMKYPLFRDRFEGMVSRETGEAVMGRAIQDDLITIPFKKGKDGKPLKVSKSRFMMGITMMDSLTIVRLYEAVKLETADRMSEPAFAKLSEEEIKEHNINRLQEIVDKTQPTFDQTNRSGLAKSSNPIWRVMTMFSSATQKIGEQLMDSMIDYNLNPNSANLKAMMWRTFHTTVTTSVLLTTIDILWAMAKGGWDDDDDDAIAEMYLAGMATSSLGSIHILGAATKGIISELDSRPWRQTVQDPVLSIFQEGYGSISNLFKGNFLKALKGSSNAVFKSTGIPITPINVLGNYIEKVGKD